MPRNFRHYVLVNTGIILGSFIVFGVLFFFLSRGLAGQAAGILGARATIASRALEAETLAELQAGAEAAGDVQEKIDVLLPSQDGLIAFPQFLDNMARTHSLDLTFSFAGSPEPPSAASPGYVIFNATVVGSPENILAFLIELETRTTRFVANVQEASFSTSVDSSRATVEGRLFFRESDITPA